MSPKRRVVVSRCRNSSGETVLQFEAGVPDPNMAKRTELHTSVAIAFIALIALLIPVADPATDHHFYERLAFHAHVFLGEVDLEHEHLSDSPSGGDSYVATSGDGPATGAITLLADRPVGSSDFTIFEDDILARFREEFRRPHEVVIALPEKPHRPDSLPA